MDCIRFARSLQGDSERALDAAREALEHVPADHRGYGLDLRLQATVWVTRTVFGAWEAILAERRRGAADRRLASHRGPVARVAVCREWGGGRSGIRMSSLLRNRGR
jgi:hypothetical protein